MAFGYVDPAGHEDRRPEPEWGSPAQSIA